MSEIIQISIVFFVVLIVSVFMKIFKQPLIIGYILSGILVGPLAFNLLPKGDMLILFSEFGIAFLLFLFGLHLSPKVIREVGKISLITGLGQVLFTSFIGYLICIWIGFSTIASIYISIALTFSSTIIIMKLLSDKDALEKLYGRISIGVLLVQDLVAVIILIFVSSVASHSNISSILFIIFGKGLLVIILLLFLGFYIFPRLDHFLASSQEFLFLFAIVFGLGVASLFSFIGMGLEVGALLAGVVLSMSSFSIDIGSKLRPLRDFFIISFFISLGSGMLFSDISGMFGWVMLFSAFILIGKPLIVMFLMGLFGYSKKTGFMAGLTVAQISEFSLILIGMGVKVGHLVPEQIGNSLIDISSLVTLVGLITIAGSTYLIMYSDSLYKLFERSLYIFERKNLREREVNPSVPDYVLIGENRVGFAVMEYFQKTKKDYLIIDFNPKRVKKLCSKGNNCTYGDVSSSSFLEEINLYKAKMIVSTVPEVDVNLMLVRKIREKNNDSIIVVSCNRISDVASLYRAGADYVIVPHVVAGESLVGIISRIDLDKKKYVLETKKQSKDFDKRLKF